LFVGRTEMENLMAKKMIALLFTVFFFVSCDNMQYTDEEAVRQYLPKLTTIVYDSCEYVVGCDAYHAVLAHKGNCKYCKQRREEEKHVDKFKQHVNNILRELNEN